MNYFNQTCGNCRFYTPAEYGPRRSGFGYCDCLQIVPWESDDACRRFKPVDVEHPEGLQ